MNTKSENTEGGSVRIAILDDDPNVSETISSFLKPLKCAVTVFDDPADFLATTHHNAPDILITDLRMPEMGGMEVLKTVKERSPTTDVIILSGTADKRDAIQSLKLGAFDFFEKPVDREELLATVKRTVRYREALRDRDRLTNQLSFVSRQEAKRWGIDAFVGKSKAIQTVVKNIGMLQRSADTSVLITGESGTGKELVARAIHFGSSRATRPFVPVNCSAIPSELAESTLFGHARGSFTGAISDRQGCFETAHEGTIFLDEIGDMPATLQIKLLRVLEDGVIVPVGKISGRTVNVRVIAATNADLEKKIANGQFRSDLFYRLAGFDFPLPPLRERKSDIPLLVDHFAQLLSSEMGIAKPAIDPAVFELLNNFDFPGNIRELKNLIERALIESSGKTITPAHIHILRIAPVAAATAQKKNESQIEPPSTGDLPLNLEQAETALVRKAVAESKGNMAEAARMLGISRQKLYRRLAGVEMS